MALFQNLQLLQILGAVAVENLLNEHTFWLVKDLDGAIK